MSDAGWTADAGLSDGSVVQLRLSREDDAAALHRFAGQLSPETLYTRYFSTRRSITEDEIVALCRGAYDKGAVFVAERAAEIIAVAEYACTKPDEADAAFMVADAFQGHGIGSLLLEFLAAHARERGLTAFTADVLSGNASMLAVFRDVGLNTRVVGRESGVISLRIELDETAAFIAAMDERDRRMTATSIRHLLHPRSIAVIGAGREPGGIGRTVFDNLLQGPFNGTVYPVNPRADQIGGVRAYPSVAAIEAPVDLGVIAVPARDVQAAVEDCGKSGVSGVVVLSSGFAETGESGREAELRMLRTVREYGMRMVGPNCMGIINNAATVRMNATFAQSRGGRGNVAFFTQSGALGIAILEEADRLGLQLSSFVSAGNKADISGNDLLQYWEQDDDTDVILLYLESFGNPRRFSEIARRVAQSKPIVAVKGGRTRSGALAARSHTAALATSDTPVQALFHQAGVIRVDTLSDLFDVARVLAITPLPKGRRVAVVGNAGGAGILTADACEAAGLVLPELAPLTRDRLATVVPPNASIANPLDMTAMAGADAYSAALTAVAEDPQVDAVLAIFVKPLTVDADAVAASMERVAAEVRVPIIATMLGADHRHLEGVPVFAFPEAAAHALGAIAEYADWRRRDPGAAAALSDIDGDAARAVITRFLEAHPSGGQLGPADVERILAAFRIPVPQQRVCATEREALEAAQKLGYPVALKAANPELVHKTERGAVAIGLNGPAALRHAYSDMHKRLGDEMGGALIQRMAPAGVETIIGVMLDRLFGPLIAFGSGGFAAELANDQVFRAAPLSPVDVAEMIEGTRCARLLAGFRGTPPADVAALSDTLQRVSALAQELPEVTEMDMNPVIAAPDGVHVVDVKIRVMPPHEPQRHLRSLRRPYEA